MRNGLSLFVGGKVMEEKRKCSRISISFPVECNAVPSKRYFYTVSKNLSLTGIKILSEEFLPKSHSFKLDINLIDKVLNVYAKVVWCNVERLSERYSAGLEFVDQDRVFERDLVMFLRSIS